MEKPVVVVLNGVGSVGKTSTAKALQRIARRPILHVQMDAFLEMLPPRLVGHPDGFVFEAGGHDGQPSLAIRGGPALARLMTGMRRSVRALAEQGDSIVMDDVMFDRGEVDEYRRVLDGFDLRLVGLFAPLEVLEQRERDRGDRALGLARWQYERVHHGVIYNLQIDTARNTSEQAAEIIRDAFGL